MFLEGPCLPVLTLTLHFCSHLGVMKAEAAEFRASKPAVLLPRTIPRPNVSFSLQSTNTKLNKMDSRQAHGC